jgi:hypothetical protein
MKEQLKDEYEYKNELKARSGRFQLCVTITEFSR